VIEPSVSVPIAARVIPAATDGFRNLPWTLGFLVSVTSSMLLLQQASRVIPMGTAYAVWAGIGALGTVGVGILLGEPVTTARMLLVLVLIAAIVGLKLVH
jgi:quaternary ammonium compound-resistance protein SugE